MNISKRLLTILSVSAILVSGMLGTSVNPAAAARGDSELSQHLINNPGSACRTDDGYGRTRYCDQGGGG
jgi:hypothetical protein